MSGQRGPIKGHGAMVTYFQVPFQYLTGASGYKVYYQLEKKVSKLRVWSNAPLTICPQFVSNRKVCKGTVVRHTDKSLSQNIALVFQKRAIYKFHHLTQIYTADKKYLSKQRTFDKV